MVSGCDPCATLLLHIATATPPPKYEEQFDLGGTVETGGEDACGVVEPQPTTNAALTATSGRDGLFMAAHISFGAETTVGNPPKGLR